MNDKKITLTTLAVIYILIELSKSHTVGLICRPINMCPLCKRMNDSVKTIIDVETIQLTLFDIFLSQTYTFTIHSPCSSWAGTKSVHAGLNCAK